MTHYRFALGGVRSRKNTPHPRGNAVILNGRGKKLGEGKEARIYERTVEVIGKGQTRSVHLAEKKFRRRFWVPIPNFRRPMYHFLAYEFLKSTNMEGNLGLHLLPTLRLASKGGNENGDILLKTKLPPLTLEELSAIQKREFAEDKERQVQIMKKLGIISHWSDVFYPVINRKTNRCEAVINDYGTLALPKNQDVLSRLVQRPRVKRMVGRYVLFRMRIEKMLEKRRKNKQN